MKQFLLFFIFISFSLTADAQNQQQNGRPRPDFQSIIEKRYSMIAHELELDEAKAKSLKPVYFEYCKKMGELFKPNGPRKKPYERTDAEIEQDIKNDFTKAKRMISLRESYYAKFRKILTPRQIEKIYNIERMEQRMIHNHNFQKNHPPKK